MDSLKSLLEKNREPSPVSFKGQRIKEDADYEGV